MSYAYKLVSMTQKTSYRFFVMLSFPTMDGLIRMDENPSKLRAVGWREELIAFDAKSVVG